MIFCQQGGQLRVLPAAADAAAAAPAAANGTEHRVDKVSKNSRLLLLHGTCMML
jgi:hypothetical protein